MARREIATGAVLVVWGRGAGGGGGRSARVSLPAKGISQGFVDGLVIFSSLLKESISKVRSVVKSKEFMVFVNFLLPS